MIIVDPKIKEMQIVTRQFTIRYFFIHAIGKVSDFCGDLLPYFRVVRPLV